MFYYRVTISEIFRFFIVLILIHTCHQRESQRGDCNDGINLKLRVKKEIEEHKSSIKMIAIKTNQLNTESWYSLKRQSIIIIIITIFSLVAAKYCFKSFVYETSPTTTIGFFLSFSLLIFFKWGEKFNSLQLLHPWKNSIFNIQWGNWKLIELFCTIKLIIFTPLP